MSETPEKVNLPTEKEMNKILEWVACVLPSVIEVFAIVTAFNIMDCPFLSNFTYVLICALHAIKFYEECTSFKRKNDSFFKILLYDVDAHLLLFTLTFAFSGTTSLLFFIDVILRELLPCVNGLYKIVSEYAKDLKESFGKLRDSVKDFEYLSKTIAGIEIFLIFYLFFMSIINLSLAALIALAVYFVGFIMYMYLIDNGHKFIWNWLYKNIANFASQNKESFGNYILQALEFFSKVGQFSHQIYPDANNFFEFLKRKVE